jgi:molybdenum cofactor guanylyltransferase
MNALSKIPFSGAVLAGGHSSRFGENKAFFSYQGKALASWVLESLAEADERFIVANTPLELGVSVYRDIAPGSNSLSGLHTALTYAKHDWVAVAACDLPFLTPLYWQLLLEQSSNYQIVIAENASGQLEPLAALYHRSLLPQVEAQMKSGDLMLKRIAHTAVCKTVSWKTLGPHVAGNLFLNVNYKTDLP